MPSKSALILERLDALILTYMPKAITGSRDAAEIVLKADKRRADLPGLDGPAKVTHTGAGRGPIEHQHDVAASLANKLARLAAAQSGEAVLEQSQQGPV